MRKLFKFIGVAIGLLLLALCYLVFVGFEINSKYINDKITDELTLSLGRQVSVEGPVLVHVSMMPSVSLHGLHIANPEEFSSDNSADFLFLKEAHLSLNLWGLFKNRLIVQKISGDGLTVGLREKANGENNWTFKSSPDDPNGLANVLELLERSAINDVDFKRLNLTFQHEDQPIRYFNLDLMEASIPSGEKIKIELNGKVEQAFPYHFALNADSLTNLANAIKVASVANLDSPSKNTNQTGWSFQARLDFLDSQSKFSGSIQNKTGRLNVALMTPNLEKFGKILDTSLPNLGQTKINSELVFTQNLVEMNNFKATFANTEVNGDFSLAVGDKPTLKGDIYLPSLDVTPFLAYSDKETSDAPQASQSESFMQVYKQLLSNDFDLAVLNTFNADIRLKLDQLNGLPADIKNGALSVKLIDGKMSIPMELSMAGVNLKGQLDAHSLTLGRNKQSSLVKLHLWANNQDIADFGEAFAGVQGVKGNLGKLDINLSAQGHKVGDAFERLTLKTTLENSHLSYGNIDGGKPVDFSVTKFNFDIQPYRPLSSNFIGSLLNQPINLTITGDALTDIVKSGRGHYELSARSKSASVYMQATSAVFSNSPELDVHFKIDASDSRDLANWFGLQSHNSKAFVLDGALHAGDNQQWRIDHLSLKLGHSDLSLSAEKKNLDKKPLILVDLHSNSLDIREIKSVLPEPDDKKASGDKAQDKLSFNIPILPQGIDLTDANINVGLAKIDGAALPITNVAFKVNIKEGFIGTSPFSVDVNDIHNHGAIYLDLRSADPVVKFWFASDHANVGPILKQLKLSQNIEANFEQLTLYMESHASLLGDLIGQAKMLGDLTQGTVSLKDPQTKKSVQIRIDAGAMTAAPNEKIALKLIGAINENPIDIKVETGTAKDLIDVSKRIPFELNTKVAKTELNFTGSLSRKTEDADLNLHLKVTGQNLSDLNRLLDVDIPPWGPWSLSGAFNMTNKSYEVSDFDLQVGESHLKGRGALLTDLAPMKLDVNLNAHQIRLDDFRMDGWAKSQSRQTPEKDSQKPLDKALISQKIEQFLNPNFMRSANVALKAKVDRVISGNDKLGEGTFDFTLLNGQATIGPVSVESDKGRALWWLKYQPREKDIQLDFHADVSQFDYGVIARHIQPKSDVKGKFNLKVDVASQAPHLSELWKYAGGDLEFAVLPENQKSGVFDLWAVNVLTGLLPVVDPSKESKVNCAIGQFHLENGVVREKELKIDTSRMRVEGVLFADLKSQQLFAKVRPQAKQAQFLSLATPIEVKGTFEKFNIGPSLFDVAETALRIGTSVFWVPLKKLFGEKMQADGADICPAF